MKISSCVAIASLIGSAGAFSVDKTATTDRRSLLLGGVAAIFTGAATLSEPASAIIYPAAEGGYKLGDTNSVVGREIRSFNSLVYNFKNSALDGGLDATKINEPSVSFVDFGEKMKNGEVTFVEFMAPFGETAYVTFKPSDSDKSPKPIRIGQGYPTMSKNSWSSPDYVIRSVSNFGVPYKFTVPLLAKYNKKK
mmetsp:Transcript_14438/g.17552  ORF Transcript_14438/g.17552 Transcript_14438/m.17552 type:complete len:194 (-) Transcript_14438:90-671(-)